MSHRCSVTLVLSLVSHPCLSQCALVCMVLVSCWGPCVICVGCPGPWILVRKVLCAQVMLLVGDGVVQSRRIHDVVQGLVVTEVLFGLGLELEQ